MRVGARGRRKLPRRRHRALAKGGSFGALSEELRSLAKSAKDRELAWAGQTALDALAHAEAWISKAMNDPNTVEAGARRFALTLARAYGLAALVRHAQWSLEHERDRRAAASAVRYARRGVDLISDVAGGDAAARALANDGPLPA